MDLKFAKKKSAKIKVWSRKKILMNFIEKSAPGVFVKNSENPYKSKARTPRSSIKILKKSSPGVAIKDLKKCLNFQGLSHLKVH